MKYFGTDGIRGKAYDYISESMAYAVGRSMGLLKATRVVISRDTRESGQMIIKAIKHGVLDAGLEVIDIDIQSTPILAFMSVKEKCYGIMVTASHNPYMDNGIKIFFHGRKSKKEDEEIIERVIDGEISLTKQTGGLELEYVNPLATYFSLYEPFITQSNLHICLDMANGAAIKAAKHVFQGITKELVFIGDNPNGLNINEGVGSTHMGHIQTVVKEHKLDLGFAFDGDGDRVLTVDNDGVVIDGDLMIYIFATYLKEQDELQNDTVVLTKMSNMGIIEALEQKGISVIQTDIGDKYVIQAMEETGAVLGGENSGHVINKKLFISGDGVLNAAFLVKILEEKQCQIKDLIKDVTFYPDRLYNMKNVNKSLAGHPDVLALIETIKTELNGKGKVLVRPSGTEPLLRISASAKTMDSVNRIIERIVTLIQSLEEKE